MPRKKLRLIWVENRNARKSLYKTRAQGLIKKTNEISLLCDVNACLILYSLDDDHDDGLKVWPSHEIAKSLLEKFIALPHFEKNRKALDPESFTKETIKKCKDNLTKVEKKIKRFEINNLMFQLQEGHRIVDFSISEINDLVAFLNEKIPSSKIALESMENPNDLPRINEFKMGFNEGKQVVSEGEGSSRSGSENMKNKEGGVVEQGRKAAWFDLNLPCPESSELDLHQI